MPTFMAVVKDVRNEDQIPAGKTICQLYIPADKEKYEHCGSRPAGDTCPTY